MGAYIVLSRLTPQGRKLGKDRFKQRSALQDEVELAGGKVVEQFVTFGDYDFCTIVSLPNNGDAQRIETASEGFAGIERIVLPAIDLPLFLRLCDQTTETTGPHRWQLWRPARWFRRLVQPFMAMNRDARRVFKSFVVEGGENLADLRGPAIFICNHSSHLDTPALNWAIPPRYRYHAYWGSAADRWFIKGRKELYKQGWWRSLTYGCFPIQRGGGSKTLDYPKWVLSKGGSIVIFPEGTRTRSGRLGKFKPGPAILATSAGVPVVPIYLDGLHALLPPGKTEMVPGPVRALIGEPLRFESDADIAHVTRTLKDVMVLLQKECRARAEAARGAS